jgi:NAD(P)-dependent dehydrogenase (short-subunit alcohol dehydrogenase family)
MTHAAGQDRRCVLGGRGPERAARTLNAPVTETSVEDFDAILAVNARGNFLHAREAFPVMDAGAIVTVGSVSSVVAFEIQVAYAAPKGAIAQITRVLALEGGKRGIRVNSVLPGVIDTDIMDGVVDNGREMLASFGAAHPWAASAGRRRWPKPSPSWPPTLAALTPTPARASSGIVNAALWTASQVRRDAQIVIR